MWSYYHREHKHCLDHQEDGNPNDNFDDQPKQEDHNGFEWKEGRLWSHMPPPGSINRSLTQYNTSVNNHSTVHYSDTVCIAIKVHYITEQQQCSEAVQWWIVLPRIKVWSADESAFTICYNSISYTRIGYTSIKGIFQNLYNCTLMHSTSSIAISCSFYTGD